MDNDNVDSIFGEMTAGLEMDLDCADPEGSEDLPFALTANGTIAVNIDNAVRLLLREAASELRGKLRAAEMTVLPTPTVDGDPTDVFGSFSAQSLTDMRIERLGALMASVGSKEIDAETAHVWISAANDIRLDVRAALEAATEADVRDPDTAQSLFIAAHVHDLTLAVSSALIPTLRS